MIVYLARDIPAFVMYCVNEESGSFLLIESTDSMIEGERKLLLTLRRLASLVIVIRAMLGIKHGSQESNTH